MNDHFNRKGVLVNSDPGPLLSILVNKASSQTAHTNYDVDKDECSELDNNNNRNMHLTL